ncbi:hypothetical protein D3C78_1326010 [compost metagenome]
MPDATAHRFELALVELAGFGQVQAQQRHDQQRHHPTNVEHQLPATIEAGDANAGGQGRAEGYAAVHHADGAAAEAFAGHLGSQGDQIRQRGAETDTRQQPRQH